MKIADSYKGKTGIVGSVKLTIRQEMVMCSHWKCYRCPHGPYYYLYIKRRNLLTSLYIGKVWRVPSLILKDKKYRKFKKKI